MAKLGSLEDLGGVVVKKNQTQNINLSDVANIQLRSLKPKFELIWMEGKVLLWSKESEANTVIVVQKVRKLIEKFLSENEEVEVLSLLIKERKLSHRLIML